MSLAAQTTALEEAIGQVLTDGPMNAPSVTVTGAASAGATRRTLFVDIGFVDIGRDGQTRSAVAQVGAVREVEVAIDAESEATIVRLAKQGGVPVAEVLGASNGVTMAGEPPTTISVLIVERVDGVTIPRHVLRLVAEKDLGSTLTQQCAEALAAIHAVPIAGVGSALPVPAVEDVHAQCIAELTGRLDRLADVQPILRYGINWLRDNLPSLPAEVALVHGDFRNGNLIVDEGGLRAVLDWELAHVGDPMEDLAWLCLRTWRFKADDLAVGGFGLKHDLQSAYEMAGGRWRDDAFHWWTAARIVWWGIGLASQAEAFTTGLSTSIVHAASGRRVVELEYDLLRHIAPE